MRKVQKASGLILGGSGMAGRAVDLLNQSIAKSGEL
jgi:hypothetical protein